MTIIPEAIRIYPERPPIKRKVDETIILNMIKTAVKPNMKNKAVKKRTKRFLPVCSFSSCDNATPPALPKIPRYDGIRGSTHGEKKDNKPAEKESSNEG